MKKQKIIPFFIANQGCPHRCVFCNQRPVTGTTERLPSQKEIIERISSFRNSSGNEPVEVAFFGGTFAGLAIDEQKNLLDPLQPMIGSEEVISIRISTRPDSLDAGKVRFLTEMGVRTVELGAQSMDDEVLARAGRGHTAEQTVEACGLLRQAGLSVGIQLMPGLPGDTAERALVSLDRVLELKPDFLRIYPALVIEGTSLAGLYRKGDYIPLKQDEAVNLCKMMLHRAMTAGVDVIRIGLQSTLELDSAGTVLAGPYHPAFRQLVDAELCYDLLMKLSENMKDGPVTVFCSRSRISDVIGQKRSNLMRLVRERGVTVDAVRGDDSLSRLDMVVGCGKDMRRGSMLADLTYRGGVA